MNRHLIDDYLGELLGAVAPPPPSPPAPVPAAPTTLPSSPDRIDEDEFEALLDALHGGGAPGQAALPAASPSVLPAAAPTVQRAAPALDPPPSAVVAGRGQDDAAMEPQRGPRSSRWLRLRVHQHDYAVELLKVQEVLLPVGVLPLRDTGPALRGVMSLRGVVVPVLDLGLWLGLEEVSDTPQTRFVVLEHNGDSLALKVSAVLDVHAVADPEIEPAEHTLVEPSVALLRGVTRLNGQPVLLLDAVGLLG